MSKPCLQQLALSFYFADTDFQHIWYHSEYQVKQNRDHDSVLLAYCSLSV